MREPIAFFLTWTTYGTWLPGDQRGWVKRGQWIVQPPDPEREQQARESLKEDVVILNPEQRDLVDAVVVKHCEIRKWLLHARNVRTNHVHVVVTAATAPTTVREQMKSWCSRRLSEHAGMVGRSKNGQRRWRSEKGDIEFIYDEARLAEVIQYVLEMQ